jgi:hypothetical protein
MSLPTYSILDVLNFGERISVLKAEDHPLFLLCLDLVWQAALTQQGLNPRVTKVTMTTERMHSLRGITRRSVTRLVRQHAAVGSTMTGVELFYLCVNNFFCAEGDPDVLEFRAPLGSMVIRRNRRGQAMTALSGLVYHRCAFVNSLMLCLINVCGVSLSIGWLPLFVTGNSISAAMVNMRRRETASMRSYAEEGWSYAQVYWAAIWTLYSSGCIDGEVRRMSAGHDSSPIPDWYVESAADAFTLEFLQSVVFPSLSSLCRIAISLDGGVGMWQFDPDFLSDVLPTCMENPRGHLENMWCMAEFSGLIVGCTYCHYGARWMKPTTFWIQNFSWDDALYCSAACPCPHLQEGGATTHPERIGGSIGHGMAEKWHIPFDLCTRLLQAMLLARPGATWYLTLFGGAGSMDLPCKLLGLTHVTVSYDRPSGISEADGSLHIRMDLSAFSLSAVLLKVWHLTGLEPWYLCGVGSHPGCESFSTMDRSRDHSPEGFHLALTPGALAADSVAYGCACAVFPGLSTWFYSPPSYSVKFTNIPLATDLSTLEDLLEFCCTDFILFTRPNITSMEAWAVFTGSEEDDWFWNCYLSLDGSVLGVSPFSA